MVKVPAAAPHDVSGLEALAREGAFDPAEVVAVLGKTEGNGCVNDFTRGYAVRALRDLFSGWLGGDAASRVSFVMSGGTEGVLSPHFTVIGRSAGGPSGSGGGKPAEGGAPASDAKPAGRVTAGGGMPADGRSTATGGMPPAAGRPDAVGKSLAVGVARTRDLKPEEIGRLAQAELVAQAVREAMRQARIANAADVHFVQIKCPLLTSESIGEAARRGKDTVTDDTYKSMGYSRGASSLGVAAALGEIDAAELADADICKAWHKYSRVASASAGSELACCEVIVLGNSAEADGSYFIDHGVMRDAIDGEALRRVLEAHAGAELVQVLAKAEADPSGFVRGRRHTMLNDSDLNHTRHARAVVGGVLAAVCGDPMIYVSGGAEHQGPSGGGPVAAVFRRKNLPV